ncbi:MAG: hypothetical protein GTN49_01775 [candidate division Zixibacteria bacterium]|nr:hypothetical protein [candidate division Zixibacteria bacterium]
MANERDVERYFEELGYDYEMLGPTMWVVDAAVEGGFGKVVVSYSPPLVVLRLKVVELPKGRDDAKLFRALLEANARDVVHGAFGLEDNAVVVVDTLEAEYLDVVELQASVDSMAFAAATILPRLEKFGVK